MGENHTTDRLLLNRLMLLDTDFIFELLNSANWIKFIGDKNIYNRDQAESYIESIISDPLKKYWVVKLKHQQVPIGIITLIKRDYLDGYDIGFAFLNRYSKQGYAFEASKAVLSDQLKKAEHINILAITTEKNTRSIGLLSKLGMHFSKEMKRENSILQVFSITVDKFLLNELTESFFNIFTNANHRKPELQNLYTICLPEAIIIKKSKSGEDIYSLSTFIAPRRAILSNGTLTEFEERETSEETKIIGNIAQRHSKYQKEGYINGVYFKGHGNKLFQFVKTGNDWKISAVIWEDNDTAVV